MFVLVYFSGQSGSLKSKNLFSVARFGEKIPNLGNADIFIKNFQRQKIIALKHFGMSKTAQKAIKIVWDFCSRTTGNTEFVYFSERNSDDTFLEFFPMAGE